MNWNSLQEFLSLRGYGSFVWGSYALALLCMLIEPWLVAHRHRRALADMHEQHEDR